MAFYGDIHPVIRQASPPSVVLPLKQTVDSCTETTECGSRGGDPSASTQFSMSDKTFPPHRMIFLTYLPILGNMSPKAPRVGKEILNQLSSGLTGEGDGNAIFFLKLQANPALSKGATYP